MPLPKIPLPEPPTHLQELLDQARNADEMPFVRVTALATLLIQVERWFEEMAAFCHERGGTLGMDAAALRRMVEEREQGDPDEEKQEREPGQS